MALSYFQLQERLDEIMRDLVNRVDGYERAAEDLARVKREVDKRLASIRLSLKFPKEEGAKDTVQAREDKALTALAAAADGIYEQWVEAEAMYAGSKAAIDTLDKAATVGMSLLKALQREAEQGARGANAPQPAWSRNGAAA